MDIFSGISYEEASIVDSDMFAALGIRLTQKKERSKSRLDEDEAEWTIRDIVTDSEHNGAAVQDRDIYLSKQDAQGSLVMRLWLTGMEAGHQRVNVFNCDYELPEHFNTKKEFLRGLKLLAESGSE